MSNLNVSVTQLNFYGKNLGVLHANIMILLRPIFIVQDECTRHFCFVVKSFFTFFSSSCCRVCRCYIYSMRRVSIDSVALRNSTCTTTTIRSWIANCIKHQNVQFSSHIEMSKSNKWALAQLATPFRFSRMFLAVCSHVYLKCCVLMIL